MKHERYHHSVDFIRVLLLYIHHTGKNWEGSELDFRQCQTTILRLSCIKLSSCNHWHVECFCYFHGNDIQNYQNTSNFLCTTIPSISVYQVQNYASLYPKSPSDESCWIEVTLEVWNQILLRD